MICAYVFVDWERDWIGGEGEMGGEKGREGVYIEI